MHNKRNKNLSALLAFFGGVVGLHRFYLGQKGMGFLMIFLAFITMGLLSTFIGIIDAIVFLNMSEEKFDIKYNEESRVSPQFQPRNRYKSYERYRDSSGYQNEKEQIYSYRRDRRIDPEEYLLQKRNSGRARNSPYQAKESRSRRGKQQTKKQAINAINKFKNSGIDKFKAYDIEGAIKDFQQILIIDPDNIAANFNIACAYSQLEKPDKVMQHLSIAVKAGFDDFDKIKKHEKLAYARIQPEWEIFEKNGFIFEVNTEDKMDEAADYTSQPIKSEMGSDSETEFDNSNLLENLSRLKELRDRGVLSDLEFELERRKLMSS